MERPNVGPEWIIAGPDDEAGNRSESHQRLLDAARTAWPKILLYARLSDIPDSEYLANEVWEELLRSVVRTMRRLGTLQHVTNLESYLIGAFRHRFQRALAKEKRDRQKILLTESVENLESFSRIQNWKPVEQLEREVQIQRIYKGTDASQA